MIKKNDSFDHNIFKRLIQLITSFPSTTGKQDENTVKYLVNSHIDFFMSFYKPNISVLMFLIKKSTVAINKSSL